MSYDNQTELVICYEAEGKSRARYALHPYACAKTQEWTQWDTINDETTYYINEVATDMCVELQIDEQTKEKQMRRNKHELFVGKYNYTSMICVFDPSPTGLEEHIPGRFNCFLHSCITHFVKPLKIGKTGLENAPDDKEI